MKNNKSIMYKKKLLHLHLPLLGVFFLASLAHANSVVIPDAGKHSLKCDCILATTGCASNLFFKLAGSQIHTWQQDFHTPKVNYKVDEGILAKACYRKRNVDKQGDGLCCEPLNDNAISKYFRGNIQK